MRTTKRSVRVTDAQLRRVAVEASCDPRTVLRVLEGACVCTLARERARDALVRAGLLPLVDQAPAPEAA
jgi:hypothetical protein